MEKIDWSIVDPTMFEYHRAVYGTWLPLPDAEYETVDRYGRSGWETVHRAAQAIIDTRNIRIYERPKDFRTGDCVIVEFLNRSDAQRRHEAPVQHDRGSKTWHSFMTVALCLAKRRVEFWGVSDPTQYSYCAYCRQVFPIRLFTRHEAVCDRHKQIHRRKVLP